MDNSPAPKKDDAAVVVPAPMGPEATKKEEPATPTPAVATDKK